MRRILVPLDGTPQSAAILPDARRLAGPDGVLILLNEVGRLPPWGKKYPRKEHLNVQSSRRYLDDLAAALRAQSVRVEPETILGNDKVRGIDDAAMVFRADMVAVAASAPGARARLPHGSIAWEALARSPVPVLTRYIADAGDRVIYQEPDERRIMVPLDGSPLAEKALPLACRLADEWNASIWLFHVVSQYPITEFARTEVDPDAVTLEEGRRAGWHYLDRVAARLRGNVQKHVLRGSPADRLVDAAAMYKITDVVLSSHGRTGLQHTFEGSVTDDLIHRLDLPIVVVPAQVAEHTHRVAPATNGKSSRTAAKHTQAADRPDVRKDAHRYTNIVVALDGSKESEAVLPYIEPIARALDSRVTFVCALVPIEETLEGEVALTGAAMGQGMMWPLYDARDELARDDTAYLAALTKSWAARGFDVAFEEPQMRAAEAIVTVARDKRADLIAMVTREEHGLKRTVVGSVADEVVRTAPCAVMLARPE